MIKTLTITIWERDFSLPVKYEFDGEGSVSQKQLKALEDFTGHPDWITNSKYCVESFCIRNVLEDDENSKKDNIFSYIKPDYILVKHDEEYPRIALMCKYRYDMEHGLAVVFSAEGKVRVGMQDIIL